MIKLDRMSVSESILAEVTASDIMDAFNEIVQAMQDFEETREAAEQHFGEAAQYHEERDWDARNDSLNEAQSAIGSMGEALDLIEANTDWHHIPEDRMAAMRKAVDDVENHLGYLVEM
jgi:hypothetical protein